MKGNLATPQRRRANDCFGVAPSSSSGGGGIGQGWQAPSAGASMSNKSVQDINLSACRKLDAKVTKVIATASHVVLYSLSGAEWVRPPSFARGVGGWGVEGWGAGGEGRGAR